MKRRDLLAGLLPVAAASLARAQQPGEMYRIAIFHPTAPVSAMSDHSGLPWWEALYEELRRLGYEEGRNLSVERYSGGGQRETYSHLMTQIVATQPDLILVLSPEISAFNKAAAGKVPIVSITADPIAMGLTTSLSRPSANVTGVVTFAGVPELLSKRFQLLREIRPGSNHLAVLTPRSYWDGARGLIPIASITAQLAQQFGFRLTCLCPADNEDAAAYRQAFANLDRDRPDVILLWDTNESFSFRELIVGLVNEARIPALYPTRVHVELGGLISYGYDLMELNRHLAHQMDPILRGRPVSEVPFYQPTKWELVIN